MASGDIYEVTHVQVMQEQEVLNVYFYEQRAAFVPLDGNIAQSLANEWLETIVPEILACQSSDILSVEVRVRNLFDATDQGVAVDGSYGSGGTTMDSLPVFNAWGLQFNTDNAAVRPGAKRIGGIPESQQVDGVPIAGMVTSLNALGDVLAAPITGGLIITDDIMFPVVVKRVRTGSPGAYTYRLPETSGEAVVGTIIETLVKLYVTSQISRKIGFGS